MDNQHKLIDLAVDVTAAWLGNANTRASAQSASVVLLSAYVTLSSLPSDDADQREAAEPETFTPAVSVRRSLSSPDHIISLIDGKPYRTLRRHLTAHGLTPAAYRERFGLQSDYPLVAPTYATQRREIARRIGLGRPSSMRTPNSSADEPSPRSSEDVL